MGSVPEAYSPVVRGVTITPDGVGIEYTIPARDVLPNGLMHNHIIFLPDDTYDEHNATIRQALKLAVKQALLDADDPSNRYHTPPEVEDDDEVGQWEYPPGQGPGADNDRTHEDRQARPEAVAPTGDQAGS